MEKLIIEGVGDFDIAKFMNIDEDPGPGFQKINFTVKIKAKNATPEQLKDLVGLSKKVSPVGDTLTRPVALNLKFEIE